MSYNNGIDPSVLPEALLRDAMNTLPPHIGTFAQNTDSDSSPYNSLTQVRLEIIEQPKSRGFRFRYDCEGQSHGGLPGENSEKNRRQKTYPTVRMVNYRGRARVMVSLVTDTDPAMPHAHSIVGKNSVDGRCIVEIGPETDMYAQFTSLGILHVTKKKVPEVLIRRLAHQAVARGQLVDQMDIDMDTSQLTPEDNEEIRQQALSLSKSMNLSVVRLCFQAFLPDENGRFTIPVDPVFSHKVYDSKAPSAGTLKICRLDKTSGTVKGGDDIFLLCDKVQKNDIEVVFYEDKPESASGLQLQPWMAKGRFGPNDVHHQYAIVFQTPAFYNQAIEHPVQVWIALKRPSDMETSEPKPFLYLPQEFDEERIGQKRRKKMTHFNNFFEGGGGPGGGTGGGPGGNIGGGGNFFSRDFFNGGTTGGSYNNSSGFNFFGGSNTGSGTGTGTGYNNTTSSIPSTSLDSLYSTLPQPQRSQAPIYAATATNPGTYHHYTSYSQQQLHQPHSFMNPPIYTHHPLQTYGLPAARSGGGGVSVPGGVVIKKEPGDNGTAIQPPGSTKAGEVMRPKDQIRPPSNEQGNNKLAVAGGNIEDVESGFVEPSDRMDSGLPSSMTVDESNDTQNETEAQQNETEAQQALHALKDRQQMAFEVCDRMFNALLAWATTKDIRYLLAAQRSLTAVQNQEGDTALHLAIIHNHQDVVLQLLDVLPQLPPTETPVVDCLNNFKQSPLHLAVITRQHKVVQYLLKANANPLVSDRNGDTPLHLACKYGFLHGIMPLLTRNTRINTEGCHIPELVMRNNEGLTPLHLAAVCGNPDCFKELAKANADVNVQDSKSGKSALHYLIEKGDLPLTGFLITESNANIECTDFSGNTPLLCAAAQGNVAIVSLLIAAGASLVCQNQEGETPLVLAEYGNHDEVVKVLKDAMIKGGIDQPEEQLSSKMKSVSLTEEEKSLLKSATKEGDLATLDFRPRISLALILDPKNQGSDWKALAKCLSLSHLEGGLETMTSPTKELLTMYEACDGTIAKLRQALLDINRSDAVSILDRYLQEEKITSTSIQAMQDQGTLKGTSFPPSAGIHVTMPSTQV